MESFVRIFVIMNGNALSSFLLILFLILDSYQTGPWSLVKAYITLHTSEHIDASLLFNFIRLSFNFNSYRSIRIS